MSRTRLTTIVRIVAALGLAPIIASAQGRPTGAQLTAPAISPAVYSALHWRTIGPEGNRFDQFLSKLAEQNYGQYRRVDE